MSTEELNSLAGTASASGTTKIVTATSPDTGTLLTNSALFAAAVAAIPSIGTLTVSGSDLCILSHGGTIVTATVTQIVTAGGGGGGGALPVLPRSGSAYSSGWLRPALSALTQVGVTTAALTDVSTGPITMIDSAGVSAVQFAGDVIPSGGGTWTATTMATVSGAASNHNQGYPLALYDSTTGKFIVLSVDRGANAFQVTSWNSTTAFGSVLVSSIPIMIDNGPIYGRCYFDGTDINLSVSVDGEAWVAAYSASITAFLSQVTHVGAGLANAASGSGHPIAVSLFALHY